MQNRRKYAGQAGQIGKAWGFVVGTQTVERRAAYAKARFGSSFFFNDFVELVLSSKLGHS
jgi:hypothetical protein